MSQYEQWIIRYARLLKTKILKVKETLNINFPFAFDRLQKYCLSAENERFEKKDIFCMFW